MFRYGLVALGLLWAAPVLAQTSVTGYCYSGGGGTTPAQFSACPGNLPTTNRSATITTGNTFQTIFAGGIRLNSLTVQNNNATDNCWLYLGSGTATKATAILLSPGGSYTRYYPFVPSDALQGTCASNSDTMYVDTQ